MTKQDLLKAKAANKKKARFGIPEALRNRVIDGLNKNDKAAKITPKSDASTGREY